MQNHHFTKTIKGKTCLVTGASSGLGKEIALGLAQLGAHVVMVCRESKKARTIYSEIQSQSISTKINLIFADLSSQAEIIKLATTIKNQYVQLHVLINNAGTVLTQRAQTIDGIETTLATNHLAPFLLSQLLLPLLQHSKPARIINISSAIHKSVKLELNDLEFQYRKYQFFKAYAQSKLLMNITSFELAKKLANTGITVNCLHPGAVNTNLGSSKNHNFLIRGLDRLIKSFFISPKQAAQAALWLASAPQFDNVTGQYFEKFKLSKPNPVCYDQVVIATVWAMSMKKCNLLSTID